MIIPFRWITAALLVGAVIAQPIAAHGQTVVARWIQLGPGSSAAALANGQYGDQPTSTTPTILARAIINGGACPALTVDGSLSITMATRVVAGSLTSTPGTAGFSNDPAKVGGTYPQYFVSSGATSTANFPDGTAMATTSWAECEAVVPAGHTTATIGATSLKLPQASPRKILVIADTGCRMASYGQQNCHSASAFPFAALANYEALFQPDLIIHVGDYFYRDTSCQVAGVEAFAGCGNPTNAAFETWGDTFDSWNADFFFPGQALLASAPWVMVRGNHESCGRGARGWFALLDPWPYDFKRVICTGGLGTTTVSTGPVYTGDFTPTYVVPAGQVNLLVHDSSYADDTAVDANMAKNYDYDLTALLKGLPKTSYGVFVTHKPSFGMVKGAPNDAGDFTEQYAFTGAPIGAASAFVGGIPERIALFLSGHIHQFEYVNFDDYAHYAPQMIVGMAGDRLDASVNPKGSDPTYAYQSQAFAVHSTAGTAATSTIVRSAYSQAEFGFALLQATPTGYIANVYTIDSNQTGRCTITLSPRNIACWD